MSPQRAAANRLLGNPGAGSRAFVQATLDWLPAHVAVLDGDGEIIMTNGAWVQFALDNGGRPTGPGENYLAVCDAAPEDVWATEAAAGIRAVLERPRFRVLDGIPMRQRERGTLVRAAGGPVHGPGERPRGHRP